jgi:anti-sigma B factor antagonist
MTRTPLAPSLLGSAMGSDESVVAVTLSWPLDAGDVPVGKVDGGSHIIELIGDVDVILVSRVRSLLVTLAAQSSELAVDVSGVQFIDSEGLDLLGLLHGQVLASNGRWSLIGAGSRMRRLLSIAGLEHLVPTQSSCP